MHATIRRYEGVDAARTDELTRKVGETLVPRLKSLEGFSGYYLIEADNGVFSSVGLFKEPAQSDEATKIATGEAASGGRGSARQTLPSGEVRHRASPDGNRAKVFAIDATARGEGHG